MIVRGGERILEKLHASDGDVFAHREGIDPVQVVALLSTVMVLRK